MNKQWYFCLLPEQLQPSAIHLFLDSMRDLQRLLSHHQDEKLVPWQRPRLHCQCPACANRLEDEGRYLHEDKRISYLSSRIICVRVVKVLGSTNAVGEDLQVIVCEMVSCLIAIN